jgi:hypothetical protein
MEPLCLIASRPLAWPSLAGPRGRNGGQPLDLPRLWPNGEPAGFCLTDRGSASSSVDVALECRMDGPGRPLAGPRIDADCVREVSAVFRAATLRPVDVVVTAAYRDLQRQSDLLFCALTVQGRGVSVRFTRCLAPYKSDRELIRAVRSTRVLEVTTAATDRDRPHHLLGCEMGGPYDRFRAVHDLLGHVATDYGFDQDGEYRAWRVQSTVHSGLARWALATELHAENSVLCDTGQIAEHKPMLLPRDLVIRSFRGCRRR